MYNIISALQIFTYLIRVSSNRCPRLHSARLFAEQRTKPTAFGMFI